MTAVGIPSASPSADRTENTEIRVSMTVTRTAVPLRNTATAWRNRCCASMEMPRSGNRTARLARATRQAMVPSAAPMNNVTAGPSMTDQNDRGDQASGRPDGPKCVGIVAGSSP